MLSDPNIDMVKASKEAAREGHQPNVDLFLKSIKDTMPDCAETYVGYALVEAVKPQDCKMATYLLDDEKADANYPAEGGNRLGLAIRDRDPEMIELLLLRADKPTKNPSSYHWQADKRWF